MNLKCKEMRCKYNHNFYCTAKNVNITEKTYCATFDDSGKIKKYANHIFEEKAEADLVPNSHKVKVLCSAECIFNSGGHCIANGITVMQEKHPLCQTFLVK
ncbi:MAG: DUF1540 domain-containing protein [Clostridia bacterium]|jgi:hypothetical protein|nr:DUF1540 domain-containing protein [Clostridia bacterium]